MAIGPGKYDDLATYCLTETNAEAVVVIVFNGNRGSGLSAKEGVIDFEVALGSSMVQRKLPAVLRAVALDIEREG